MTYASTVAPFVDRCLFGDALERLRAVPNGIVHCAVTSPPFYGLRDYGVEGQIGLEATPEEYVKRMVGVFREVRRVLRPDGCLFLEIGDSYNGSGGAGGDYGEGGIRAGQPRYSGRHLDALKPKDLIGIPWLLAFALRADGWYLRADIIWHRPNPMPESVTDRPTKSHSYVFLLSKSRRYFYDADAVREAWADERCGDPGPAGTACNDDRAAASRRYDHATTPATAGRNLRSVWTIPTAPYAGAHFAVMPPALAKRCIMAGSSEKGSCPECGAPWERVVEKGPAPERKPMDQRGIPSTEDPTKGRPSLPIYEIQRPAPRTTGWRPTCDHDAGDPVPCLVLDPFLGSGTTAMVAQDLGRRWLGVELNRDYEALQIERTTQLGLLGYVP